MGRTTGERRPLHRRPGIIVGAVALIAVLAALELFVFKFRTAFINLRGREEIPAFRPDGTLDRMMSAQERDEEFAAARDRDARASEPMTTPGIAVLGRGRLKGIGAHSVAGDALVIAPPDGRRFLRFENLDSDNGPDLRVYLSAAPANGPAEAYDDDFVELGKLRFNLGESNYEIPGEVELARYESVVIWCKRFRVGFGVAPIS